MEWLSTHRLTVLITFLALSPLTQVADGLRDSLKCPVRVLKGGRVRIRSKGRVAKYVCLRGSQVLGDKYSTCVHGKWDSPVPICINSGCLPVDVPHGQVLDTYRGALVTVHCDPGYSLLGSQTLYCNGAVWNDTAPTCREIRIRAQKWCDFESEDLCGWTHDLNHDFDWRRHNFATPSGHIGTGPSFDHTLGPGLSGHYMYLEVSSPRLENDTARLFSPVFNAISDPGSCFIFWYHMFGTTTGSLNVYLHKEDTVLLFSKTGNQGDQWIQAALPLPQTTSSFQIVMEGVRGAGYEGDIAIDDVKLAEGQECSVSTTSTLSDEQVTATEQSGSSCEGRCSTPATQPSMCECTPDCIGNNTCCPDYLHRCSTSLSEATIRSGFTTVKPNTIPPGHTTKSEISTILLNTTTSISALPPPGHTTKPETSTILSNTTTSISALPPPGHTTKPETSTILSNTTTSISALPPPGHTTKPETSTILSNTTTSISALPPPGHTTKPETSTILSNTTTSISPLHNNSVTSTGSYHPSSNTSKHVEVTSKVNQTNISSSVISSLNDSFTTVGAKVPTPSQLPTTTAVTFINQTEGKQTTGSPKVANQSMTTTALNKTFSVTTVSVPTTLSLRTTNQSVLPAKITWSSTKSSTKQTTVLFQWNPQRSTPTKIQRVTQKPKIEFVTPPPPVVFRKPAKTIWPFTKSVRNNSFVNVPTTFSTQNPKKMFNKTEKVPKSRNDVLHPVWLKYPLTTPMLPPLVPNTETLTKETTTSTTYTTTTQPPTTYFRQSNSSKTTTETKWKSKYKPRDEAPVHAQFAVPSSPSGQMVHILVLVSGILLILAMALATVCTLRRRKINRRRTEDDELDIQFLASDEILDFTLARPSMEDIQMSETRR